MKSFAQFITEGRDAPLFHATELSHANAIVAANTIEGRTFQDVHFNGKGPNYDTSSYDSKSGVSLSRSMKYATRYAFHEKQFNVVIVFELDQRKLAQNYKILPYNYYGAGMNQFVSTSTARVQNPWHHDRNEMEEYLLGSIRNLDRYLIKIHVMSELTFENMRKYSWMKELADHPLLWDSSNALEKGNWVNK